MTFRKIMLSFSMLSLSSALMAGTLTVSNELELQAFDGQKVKRGQAIQINDDKFHQIVVDASTIIDGSYVNFDPIIVRFKGSAENIFVSPSPLDTPLAASRFKKSPTFVIKTASGKQLDYDVDYLKSEGLFPGVQLEPNLAKYNQGKGKAAVADFAKVATQNMPTLTAAEANQKGIAAPVVVQTGNVTLDDLQYLFKNADKETRKNFLDWVKTQK